MANWDDPITTLWDNFTWDSGPAVPPKQPAAKLKRMKRNSYYPTTTGKQVLWLANFRDKLSNYQAALPLSAPQLAAGLADAKELIYVLGSWLPGVRNFSPACTDAVTLAQSGSGSTPLVLPVFTAPALPAGVIMVNPGALDRIFALVQDIKDAPGYTEAMGTDLGIVGSQQTAPDMSLIQPVLDAIINGGQVEITWGWGGNGAFLDMCEIQVDRGSGWTALTFDTTPNYTDTQPFPSTPTRWKYRAIYRVGDHQTGQWSAEKSVTVGG